MRTEDILAKKRRVIRRYKVNSRHIIVSGIFPRINTFTDFHRKASAINDRLERLCQDEEVSFTNACDHFYDNPDLFRLDGLHLNEISPAQLGRLLNDAVLLYSKTFKRWRRMKVT